jgi:hybrid cluster-associated redox disulfide protein
LRRIKLRGKAGPDADRRQIAPEQRAGAAAAAHCGTDQETAMSIAPDALVDDVMRRWPATIRAFLDHRMLCVGCPIGHFHTVEDACREHGVDAAQFMRTLRAVVEAGAAAPAAVPR